MPGQPAWTLTEMLECNLLLCWAGGGDCKVGPAQFFGRPNLLFSLKPIRAICFMIKHMRSRGMHDFILEQKTGVCWCVFFLEQKGGVLRVFFLEQKICSINFIQPIFPAIRETDLCSGSKRNLFGYTFTERFSYLDQIQRTVFG